MPIGSELRIRVLDLEEKDRAELARDLIISLDGSQVDADVDAAWEAEILERLDSNSTGVPPRDWRDVVETVRSNLPRGDRP